MSTQNNTYPSKVPWHSRWRVSQRLWQWSSSREALLLVLIPVAISLIASYVLPQAPAYLYTDEFRRQEWLSARQVEFKNWTPLLTAVGAFQIRGTLWFRALLMLLIFVLLVSLGEQIRQLLQPAIVQRSTLFYDSTDATSLTSYLSFEQTIQRVRQILGQSTVHVEEQSATHFYADRRSWAKVSSAVTYAGLLCLAGGLFVEVRGGWRQPETQVLPYEDVALGPDEALQLRLLDILPTQGNGDSPSVPTANLQIAGETILPIQLAVPVRHRGYRYLWMSREGPSVRLRAYRVSDPEHPLVLYDYTVRPQPAQSLQFSFASTQDSDRQFILSEDKAVGWLHWEGEEESAGESSPMFQIWLFGVDGQELGVETFEQTESEPGTTTLQAVVGDVAYRLEVARYIVLDVAHQPGRWVLWLGGTLLALGGLGLLVPQSTIWARVSIERDQVVVKMREQTQGLLKPQRRPDNLTVRLYDILEAKDRPEQAPLRQQTQDLPQGQDHTTHRKNQ